jgi:pilus assembly protein CpaF
MRSVFKKEFIMPAKDLHEALGPIASLFEDPGIMEIMVDGPERVTIETNGRIESTGIRFKSNAEVKQIIESVLEVAGVEMEDNKTIYEVRLTDNSRMVAILFPTAIDGHSVVFRKWMSQQITWEKLLEYHAVSPEVRELFQSAIRAHVGILIAGGTSSGKTTIANRVIELIPPDERIVVAEDLHQYQFAHPRAVLLEAQRTPNMTMHDLLTAASKMRPDWLVVGELEGAEAMRAMQLFSTGYSGLTTIHANNAEQALTRLETMCIMANLGLTLDDIRQIIVSGLRLIAHQERLPNGRRKMVQLVELKGLENGRYMLQPLIRYNAKQDTFEMSGMKPGWVI